MKNSQKDKVLKILRSEGHISRNECLRMYISRLGAIICDLRKAGMDIEANWLDGDYVYYLKDKPKIVTYTIKGTNEIVAQRELY